MWNEGSIGVYRVDATLSLNGSGHIQSMQCLLNCSLGRWSHVLPAHAVQGLCEDLRGHAVLVLQDEALLQCHRHCSAVLCTFTAGKANSVQSPANLRTNKVQIQSVFTATCYNQSHSALNRVINGFPDLTQLTQWTNTRTQNICHMSPSYIKCQFIVTVMHYTRVCFLGIPSTVK